MIFDTHAHLNFSDFDKDRDELIKKCFNNDIGIINVGTNYNSSKKAIELAEGYSNDIYASIGLHPLNIDSEFFKMRDEPKKEENVLEKDFDYNLYKKLVKSKKVVAIGEIGLDYWHKPKGITKKEMFKQKQKEVFIKQLEFAEEFNLPTIIHCRAAFDDLYEILRNRNIKSVLHCFTGDWQEAERFFDLGLFIGINGIIFKTDIKEVIKRAPLDRIIIETDCPYLSPPGFEERNNPLALKFITKEIAGIRGVDVLEIEDKTSENTRNLFKIN